MNKDNSRREFLSQSGKMVTAAALFAAAAPVVYADERSISARPATTKRLSAPTTPTTISIMSCWKAALSMKMT